MYTNKPKNATYCIVGNGPIFTHLHQTYTIPCRNVCKRQKSSVWRREKSQIQLLRQGKEIMSSSNESRYYFRVFTVNMVLSGLPPSQICEMAGVTKQAITGWVKLADEQGFDALKSKERSGRPSKLTKEQKASIDAALNSDPNKYGFKVWDGPSLSKHIQKEFGLDISVRQCQRLFHQLGYSLIRPQPYPSKGYEDSKEREAFKKNETK